MSQTILLTGITGFIAKHIAVQLLNAGYNVRGTLRVLARGTEVITAVTPHLDDATGLAQRLTFVPADLSRDAGWDTAMTGVTAVMHTASPFPMAQPKDAQSVIQPAVEGTLRVLRAAHQAGVARVILTSSTAAITGAPLPPDKTAYDEACWTDVNGPGVSAYSQSKTLAERAAWGFVRDTAPNMALTTINPGFVVGPPLDRHYGTSIAVIERILRAKDPLVPNLGFTAVDVRDVAAMHIAALRNPETSGQRIMTVDRFLWFIDMAQMIKDALPDRKIVTRKAPDFAVRVLGLFDPAIRSIIPDLGRHDPTDNARARDILGHDLRDAGKGVVDAATWLTDNRIV